MGILIMEQCYLQCYLQLMGGVGVAWLRKLPGAEKEALHRGRDQPSMYDIRSRAYSAKTEYRIDQDCAIRRSARHSLSHSHNMIARNDIFTVSGKQQTMRERNCQRSTEVEAQLWWCSSVRGMSTWELNACGNGPSSAFAESWKRQRFKWMVGWVKKIGTCCCTRMKTECLCRSMTRSLGERDVDKSPQSIDRKSVVFDGSMFGIILMD